MAQDYYEILQVHPRADAAAISAAYERLRELYNPARLEGAADELVELARQKRDQIERAYAVLSDETRRAAYDAEQAATPPAFRPPAADEPADDEEPLDYRPLPPARRAERPRDFDAQPVRRSSPAGPSDRARTAALFVGMLLIVAIFGATGFAVFGAQPGGVGLAPPPAVPTAPAVDFNQFEADIDQARAAARQNPGDPQAWTYLGNMLYNSAEIVREFQPDSELYRDRLPRWLEATEAYSQALALDPENAAVRGDFGVSACFYGAGTGNRQYAEQGLEQVQRAAQNLPDDPRVQLSLGHCLVSVQPQRTQEALEAWLQVAESQQQSSPLAIQARQLIQRYGGPPAGSP